MVCSDLGVRVPGDKGASVHLVSMSEAFAALGHDVLVVGVAGHGAPPAGVDTLLLDHPGRSEGLERARRKVAFTKRLVTLAGPHVERFRPDLVYERLALYGRAGTGFAARTGATFVVEVNALLTVEEAAWRGLHLAAEAGAAEAATLLGADLRVAVSAEVADQLACQYPGRPSVVVANGVRTELFASLPDRAAARGSLGLDQDAPIIVFVGALRPWHGLDVALTALASLPAPARLVVAGDGPVRADLEQRSKELGVAERVDWLGPVPHERVPAVLAAADVAIAPYPALTDFAFSPLKVVEYLAAGVPVVASNIGQLGATLAHGAHGQLVTPGDPSELAAAIASVLADPTAHRAIARAARAEVMGHSGWRDKAATILATATEVRAHALAS